MLRINAGLAFAMVLSLATTLVAATTQDPNVTQTVFASGSGLSDASGMCWATDGSNTLFVTQKGDGSGGHLRVIINGSLQATDFATVSPVYLTSECGLDNVVVDPNYASNKFVYVFISESSSVQRIYRYTAGMSGGNLVGSGKMQLGPDLPTAGQNHDGGGMAIGPDGYLYWGVGNNGNNSGPAGGGTGIDGGSDEHSSLASKICRMDRTNGNAIAGGPFASWGTTAGNYTFVKGARNPFGLRFHPTKGTLWLTAVGDGYEQVFLLPSGGDIGWPLENNTSTTNGKLIPKYDYVTSPSAGVSSALTRGIFLTGTQFPATYQGDFFICEYVRGEIRRCHMNAAGDTINSVDLFANGVGNVVDISVGPDGALYYVNRNANNVYRLAYSGPTQNIVASASSLTITEGASGNFNVHLAIQPAGNVTVTVARTGNSNITASPASLPFTTSNWNTNQPVTVSSVSTPDGVNDTATITLSSAGLTSQNVSVTANDTAVAMAPTAQINAPMNGQAVAGSGADFFGHGFPVSPATLAKAEFYVDGVLKYTDPYDPTVGHFHYNGAHAQWNTTLLSDGIHVLKMTVYDSNNLSGSDQVTVIVNNGTPYQQDSSSDHLVVMEAEHFNQNVPVGGHSWNPDTSFAGFSGSMAMRAMPDNGANFTGPGGYSALSPRLDYVVNFTSTGTHYVWVRGWGPDTSSDSCHVGLDGNETASAERITNFAATWTWSNMTMIPSVATINVTSVGTHCISVWMREDGFVLDKILITTNSALGTSAPALTGMGAAESSGGPGGSGGGGGPAAVKTGCGATGVEAGILLGLLGLLRRKRR